MLRITIQAGELFDERTNRFITVPKKELQMEHSLVSIAKWESKWKKPFLSDNPMTREETIDYIRCMTITQNVDPAVYYGITDNNVNEVMSYLKDSMTATTFKDRPRKGQKRVVTAEVIYAQMIKLGIPKEFEKWHLNRLLALIRVCDEMDAPGKKMSSRDAARQYAALNKARRARSGSRG